MKRYEYGFTILWLLCAMWLPSVLAADVNRGRAISRQDGDPTEVPYTIAWKGKSFDTSQLERIVRGMLKVPAYERIHITEFFLGDINKDGSKEIVAAISRICTSDPADVAILFRREGGAYVQKIATHWGSVLRDVKDLNKDGINEIVARSVLAESTGHANCVEWHAIWEWDKGRGAYIEASVKYPLYYKEVYRPLVEKRLAHLEALGALERAKNSKYGADWWRKWKQRSIADCHLALDKVRRLLEEDPRAGFDRAALWFASGDSELRKNAIRVFAEIADGPSIEYLKKAAKDENRVISQRAEKELDAMATVLRAGEE